MDVPGESPNQQKWRRRAIAAAWVISGSALGLFAVVIPFVLPALRKYCLPYVPATPIQIDRVLLQLKGRSGKVVDLGSGDGRVVSLWGTFSYFYQIMQYMSSNSSYAVQILSIQQQSK